MEWTIFENNGTVPDGSEGGTIDKYEDYIYFIGNYNNSETYYSGVYRYHLPNQTWEFVDTSGKIEARQFHRSALINSTLYILSGRSLETGLNLNEISKIDLSSFLKFETIISEAEGGQDSFGSAVKNSTIYVFGGFRGIDGEFSNKIIEISTNPLELNELSEEFISPQSRYFHSMHLISGEFYVFGGRNHKNIYNDLWKFDPVDKIWTSVQTAGNIPSARFAFAANSQGDALVVWGGEDNIGLVNDLYIYNAITEVWQLLQPVSNTIPNPAKGACIVLVIPKIFIYGGITSSGYSGALWEFNLWTSQYKLISHDSEVAYPTCYVYDGEFYVLFGTKTSSITSNTVRKYNFSSEKWSDHIVNKNFWSSTNQAIYIFTYGDIIKIGGQVWDSASDNNIYLFTKSLNSETFIGNISEFPYRAAWVYYQSYIYIYGGGEVIGQNLRMGVASNRLYRISMSSILGSDMECSAGTQSYEQTCQICPAGTYSEGTGNSSCVTCPSGTFNSQSGSTSNRQCYPCEENYYTPNNGSTFCFDCPTGYTCPPGSSNPLDLLIEADSGSIQPELYKYKDISSKVFAFQLAVGLIFLFIILAMISFKITRDFLMSLDIFTDLHNYILNKPMILRETRIGGVSMLIFICLAIILVGSTFLNFTESNIAEIKGLVPKVVLDEEVDEYVAETLTVIIRFIRYGDDCSSSEIDLTKFNIYSDSYTQSTFKDSDRSCIIEFSFSQCTLETGAFITVTSKEKLCYSSGIYVNVTSSSSIPNQISSILASVKPEPEYVFIGSDPSQFYYTMTPSLFESESSKWPSKQTGFHISSEYLPGPGSQHKSEDLSIVSQLKVNIYLDTSISGLFTKRYYKQTLIFILSSLIGSIFGVMGGVGGGMKFLEKNLGRFKLYVKKKNDFGKVKEHQKDIIAEIYDFDKKLKKKSTDEMNGDEEQANGDGRSDQDPINSGREFSKEECSLINQV